MRTPRLAVPSLFVPCALLVAAMLAPMGVLNDASAQVVRGPTIASQQESGPVAEMKADGFRLAVLKAIPTAVQEGKITRAEGLRLRVAMFSPAFAKQAKELAIIQMAASGSENVPFTESGTVDETAINWEGLTEFLKVLLPILLELLKGLGAI